MRWPGESPSAAVSPQVKPTSISLTSGEGDARVPASKKSNVVGAKPNSPRGGGEGRVPKQGRAMGVLAVEVGVSLGGVRHVPSLDSSRMSLTVCGGSVRFEYAWANTASDRKFCHTCVGRCALEPHLGEFRTVEGPIMFIICVGRGDLAVVSQMIPIPNSWVSARC